MDQSGFPDIKPPSQRLKEAQFQISLAEQLTAFGHKVALHDAGTERWPRRFSTNGMMPDLVVETAQDWIYHEELPVIAIEAKMGTKDTITDVWDGVTKLMDLKARENSLVYKVDGAVVKPVYYLFANPYLLERDVVTSWNTHLKGPDPNCCSVYLTRTVIILLSRYCAGLLTKNMNFRCEGHIPGHQFYRMMSLDPKLALELRPD